MGNGSLFRAYIGLDMILKMAYYRENFTVGLKLYVFFPIVYSIIYCPSGLKE
jgi:hypothetical protein